MTRAKLRCVGLVGALTTIGCAKVPNPHYVEEAGSDTFADESGDGDPTTGDGDPTTGDGDPTTGDGDPTTGDGDPTTGDGDPTGDGDCVAGELGCACTPVFETCADGLACVVGICVDASSCAPVNDSVQVSWSATWGTPDIELPPMAPSSPQPVICVLNGQVVGNKAVLTASQCGDMSVIVQLNIEVQPLVEPISALLGNPNLAATVTAVVTPDGFYARIDAAGMQLFFAEGTSLYAEGVTDYPWPIAAFSSACGQTPVGCGVLERLALFVDGGTVFDGNAGQPSANATAWVETVVDECEVLNYELVLLGH
jgi:hypothetical protein